ncbi:EF-hand domain-containing protein [Brucella anthropi]|uniref:EF-hand domain-containing protein n=1 Tax=Brucella anthropi TaxID=529 RepID=UPI002360C531|nr:calcium-binding protein [Brucella anthropi]
MKKKTALFAVIATSFLSVPVLAQENIAANTGSPTTETTAAPNKDMKGKRDPIDLEKFSRMNDLKAADTDGDGVLSRAEIEALALKRIVSRAADRMERRLDINGDGKVTLAEVESQRKKEFAALDRNEDGKIDRREMRAAKMYHQAKGSHHKGPHHVGNHRGSEHRGPMRDQAEKPQE